MRESIGIDCCNQEIIPVSKTVKLSVHTNRHPNCDRTDWGWIEGCTKNICWSDNKKFNKEAAYELVSRWNKMVSLNERRMKDED